MSAVAGSKYRDFRNYMVNELGVTKEDIRQWTVDAIAEQVKGIVGQINIEKIVDRAVCDVIRERAPYRTVEQAVATVLATRIAISVKP
ncbi:MAG: hypothetical protein IT382_22775 [Deltaproteobacteria bacterium]|nr:hypothetical protein [Deltaproteobacteria bacterium]